MKKLSIILIICILIFSGCANKKESKEAKTLKIGILSITDSAVLYAAKETGVFDKYGVNVELVEFGSAADQSKAMEAGELDGMMTDLIVQSLINKSDIKLKTVLIALGDKVENGKFVIAAAKDSPHDMVSNLKGAKIAISEGTMMEFLLDSYFEELGIDIGGIEKVNVPSIPLRMEMLLEGKDIDAAILPEPLGDFAAQKGAKIVIDDRTLKTNLSQSVIVLDESYIEKNTETVKAFVKAYSETAKEINKNPDKYKEMLLKKVHIPEEMKDSYELPTYSENEVTQRELFEKVQKWMLDKGLITKENAYEDMIEKSFVESNS